MYQWTPLRHTRAIGAWPCHPHLRASSWRSDSSSLSGGRARRKYSNVRRVYFDAESDEKYVIEHSRARRKHKRKDGNPDLPLPPFMWPNPGLRDQLRANQERRRNLRKEEEQNYSGVVFENDKSRIKSRIREKNAPFSFAFSLNPYARALASPVREDCFTRVNLPRSCLIAFSPLESVLPDGSSEVHHYPAALAASMISKKKPEWRLTEAEKELKAAATVDTQSFQHTGPSSYVLGIQDAIQFISEDRKSRVPELGTSRRAFEYMERNFGEKKRRNMKWEAGVPALVLEKLRGNVRKRLAHFLRIKAIPDNPGLVHALPGNSTGLERLDDISDVLAVIRLKPATADLAHDDEEAVQRVAFSSSRVSGDAQTTSEDPLLSEEATKSGTSASESESESESELEAESESEVESKPAGDQPRYWSQKMAWWRDEESYHRDLGPPPAPPTPFTIYFPTVKYRNWRVAAYNLPHLLGEDATAELVKDTAFADTEYIAVTSANGTVGLQTYLIQLAAYLGTTKENTPPV